MTSQSLIVDSSMRASTSQAQEPQAQGTETVAVDRHRSRLIEAMRSQYQLDQQVKFLHLQAEADSLLQQLQAVKQQRQASEAQPASEPNP